MDLLYHPGFLVSKGQNYLDSKAPDTVQPKNFGPITCLNVLYKLWIGYISELVLRRCVVNNVLRPAQKGCARSELGCTDHLLLNSHILQQFKSKNQSFSITWLDYEKVMTLCHTTGLFVV